MNSVWPKLSHDWRPTIHLVSDCKVKIGVLQRGVAGVLYVATDSDTWRASMIKYKYTKNMSISVVYIQLHKGLAKGKSRAKLANAELIVNLLC